MPDAASGKSHRNNPLLSSPVFAAFAAVFMSSVFASDVFTYPQTVHVSCREPSLSFTHSNVWTASFILSPQFSHSFQWLLPSDFQAVPALCPVAGIFPYPSRSVISTLPVSSSNNPPHSTDKYTKFRQYTLKSSITFSQRQHTGACRYKQHSDRYQKIFILIFLIPRQYLHLYRQNDPQFLPAPPHPHS